MLDRVAAMSVPGATRSGFIRKSSTGPRELNAARPSGLPETVSSAIGSAWKSSGHACFQVMAASPPLVRLLRLAPTVMPFFAVAGDPSDG